MVGRTSNAESTSIEVAQLARCHRLCLPQTASSRAGLDVLEGLYLVLGKDPAAHVIWRPPIERPGHEGAFASGTVNLRDTETRIRRELSLSQQARLAIQVAMMPRHVLARRRWENFIPRLRTGYVLTLGVARAVVPSANTVSGRALLSDLETAFVSGGCDESWVDTELSNERAHSFYLRLGYVEVRRDFDQVLLKKRLV